MITTKYKEQLLQLRERRPWGNTAYKHAAAVQEFADEIGAASLLDYGAGDQTLNKEITLEYHAYDPAVLGIDKRPFPVCDIVVALDVLEHVEPQYTLAVLHDIWDHARLGVFLFIPTQPAFTKLPDGRNAHINIKSAQEWLKLIKELPATRVKAEYTNDAITIRGILDGNSNTN